MLQTGLPKRGSQHSDELIELAIAVRDQGFQRTAARGRRAGWSNVTISCAWLDNQPIPKFPRQRLKNCCPSRAEPKVRIHLPPAESPRTIGSGAIAAPFQDPSKQPARLRAAPSPRHSPPRRYAREIEQCTRCPQAPRMTRSVESICCGFASGNTFDFCCIKYVSGNSYQFFAKPLLASRNFVTPFSSGAIEPSFHDDRDNRRWWMDRLMTAVSRLR